MNLYRMDKNENMELVVGNSTKMFPNGSLSGLKSGFGRNENQYIWRMEVYDGKLYVAPTMPAAAGVLWSVRQRQPAEAHPLRVEGPVELPEGLMKALATVDPNGTGNPDTLAQTIKFSYNFVFKNITVRNMASAIKLLNYLRTAKRGFDCTLPRMASTLRPLPLMALGTPTTMVCVCLPPPTRACAWVPPTPSMAPRSGSSARLTEPAARIK